MNENRLTMMTKTERYKEYVKYVLLYYLNIVLCILMFVVINFVIKIYGLEV